MLTRRSFLAVSAAATASTALAAVSARPAGALSDGDGPYGPLATEPDANGLLLPAGFTARVIARYEEPVAGSGYPWHLFPDGGATFATDDGGWIYVSNSEGIVDGTGGVGAIRFAADGEITDAYPLLTGSERNCAGGPTPWGTWLSCEEQERGKVWECDPTGERDAVELPALGAFVHEAVTVDTDREQLYLTEDTVDGRLYRFTPTAYPDLTAGTLEVAKVVDGAVEWLEVLDPAAASVPTRGQVAESTPFDGGEGIWYQDGFVWFVTKGDHGVWKLDPAASTIEKIYEGATAELALGAPDNVVMTSFGDLLVCEDQPEDQQVVMITPDGIVAPILQLTGQSGSELAGAALDPAGERLYVSSQRGGGVDGQLGGGITYEIAGPFRVAAPPAATTTSSAAVSGTTRALANAAGGDNDNNNDDDSSRLVPVLGAGALIAAGIAFAIARLRGRVPEPVAAAGDDEITGSSGRPDDAV